LGLAVFSLSNERAGPKDRKYDPSRSHYKKVSLLRDRLIPAVGSTPTIIFIPPSWRGLLGSRRPKKAIAFSGGCFLVGAPFGPRGSVAWVPALGLSAVVGSCLLRTYHTSTTTQQHNPYSNSVFDINPISPTLHSNFSSYVTPDLLGDHYIDGRWSTTSITRGGDPRVPPCRCRASLPLDRQGL
jgi:hypothetical protein